jgi:hypothetical protein
VKNTAAQNIRAAGAMNTAALNTRATAVKNTAALNTRATGATNIAVMILALNNRALEARPVAEPNKPATGLARRCPARFRRDRTTASHRCYLRSASLVFGRRYRLAAMIRSRDSRNPRRTSLDLLAAPCAIRPRKKPGSIWFAAYRASTLRHSKIVCSLASP